MDARALIELPSLDHIEEFGPGDNVTINYTVAEEGRERVQAFKGNVIRGKVCPWIQAAGGFNIYSSPSRVRVRR